MPIWPVTFSQSLTEGLGVFGFFRLLGFRVFGFEMGFWGLGFEGVGFV